MPANNLTEEQQLAFMRDRHISLTANAGSGKTTVLVNKYLDILLNYKTKDDAVPKRNVLRILAITYTKVAAAEMKSRLAKKVEELTMDEIEYNLLIYPQFIVFAVVCCEISLKKQTCRLILLKFPSWIKQFSKMTQ